MPPLSNNEKKLKLQLSPGSVASCDIQPGNGVGLFWISGTPHTVTHTRTHTGFAACTVCH